jgi:hypothetical protein
MAKQKKENRWYHEKSTLTVFLVLRFLVILTAILSAVRRDYESVFISCFTLLLFLLPSILTKRLRVTLPSTLECIILLFVFAANILGEINNFYVRVPHWDTLLHTLNGFNCAAIGFALVDMLNRHERVSLHLSPLFLSVVAFCFSMTIGVLWEFYEYTADRILVLDMQKDTVIHEFNTVTLDDTQDNIAIQVRNIADVIIVHSDGSQELLGLGGYLDIGLHDTMKANIQICLCGLSVFS